MKKIRPLLASLLTVCCVVAGCAVDSATTKTAEADRYRCENGVAFTVRFSGDSAVVDSNRGYEVLYKGARGQAASPTAYGNPQMRAEFGLGPAGNQAVLRYLLQPVALQCARE